MVSFTDEEGYGKYLDLNEVFLKYINLKGIERITYIQYLSQYDHMFAIPREKKTLKNIMDIIHVHIDKCPYWI